MEVQTDVVRIPRADPDTFYPGFECDDIGCLPDLLAEGFVLRHERRNPPNGQGTLVSMSSTLAGASQRVKLSMHVLSF